MGYLCSHKFIENGLNSLLFFFVDQANGQESQGTKLKFLFKYSSIRIAL